jgi:PhnB protein
MSIKQLNPYLIFDGTADKAIHLYQTVLGAKTEGLMRFADAPGANFPAQHKNRVLHAALELGGGTIMISDCQAGTPVSTDSNVSITLHFDDVADMTNKFQSLAVDGKVTMPLQDMFWGARFGTLTDAFGVHWMFNCETRTQTQKA